MPRLAPCPRCTRHVFTQEQACPHCGESGTAFVAALALAATIAVACAPTADVYGPAPKDTSTRTSATQTATASDSAAAPPNAKVYGPAAVNPSTRQPDSEPSASGSAPKR